MNTLEYLSTKLVNQSLNSIQPIFNVESDLFTTAILLIRFSAKFNFTD